MTEHESASLTNVDTSLKMGHTDELPALKELEKIETRNFILNLASRLARKARITSAEADDITQEVMLVANKAIKEGSFDPTARLKPWLRGITEYTILKLQRKEIRRRNNGLTDEIPEGVEAFDRTPNLNDRIADAKKLEAVRKLISAMPRTRQEAIMLKSEGLTDQEIADRLGISLAATKINIHRARTALGKLESSQ